MAFDPYAGGVHPVLGAPVALDQTLNMHVYRKTKKHRTHDGFEGLRVFVTETSHQYVWRAFRLLDADAGAPPTVDAAFAVPVMYAAHLRAVNETLRTLSSADFETFCIGEHDDVERIKGVSVPLNTASDFLTRYFEGWA